MSFKMDLNPDPEFTHTVVHSHVDDELRPEIYLDVDPSPYHDDCFIRVTLSKTLGHSMRWIELTEREARELGEMLQLIANNLEEHLAIKKAEQEEPVE